jgi:hypothetical protein
MSEEDERCCGTGHCMINADGRCWCGQQWDGEKMCLPKQKSESNSDAKSDLTSKSDKTITSAYIASDNKPA